MTAEVRTHLRSFLPPGSVLDGTPAAYLADETETRGINGRADAVVLPETVEEVAKAPGATTMVSQSSPAGAGPVSPQGRFRSTAE